MDSRQKELNKRIVYCNSRIIFLSNILKGYKKSLRALEKELEEHMDSKQKELF